MAAVALAPAFFSRPNPTLLGVGSNGTAAVPKERRQWMTVNFKIMSTVVNCAASPSIAEAQPHLKPLPYSFDALEPYLSKESVEHHWRCHHVVHVEALNGAIRDSEWERMQIEEMMLASYNKGLSHSPFLLAAQVWNHEFFWASMKPGGGGKPSGRLMQLIERDFGKFEMMIEEFKSAALRQFGSGWAWLSYKANQLDVGNAINPRPSESDHKLVISKTPNVVNPLLWDYSPLLAIDVWEHAYYLDYGNRRDDYVTDFLDKLVSWEAVSLRLEAAIDRAQSRERDDKEATQINPEFDSSRPLEMFVDSEIDSEAD